MDFLILSITSLFALINPIGIIPTYISMVEKFTRKERREITFKAALIAFFVLIVFSLMGALIFDFFKITIFAFKIVGGILFFRIGINMVESKLSRTKSTPKEKEEALSKEDIAYSPIGVPLIAGPGAITSVMILSEQVNTIYDKLIFVLSIAICMITTYIILLTANKLSEKNRYNWP